MHSKNQSPPTRSYFSGLAWGLAVYALIGALFVVVAWMVHLGCDPFGCYR